MGRRRALGGAGATPRFVIDTLITTRAGRGFPLGTLAVNAQRRRRSGLVTGLRLSGRLLLVGAATLGSYTTFSTWMFETYRLRERGDGARGLANLVISLLLGFAAVAGPRRRSAAVTAEVSGEIVPSIPPPAISSEHCAGTRGPGVPARRPVRARAGVRRPRA